MNVIRMVKIIEMKLKRHPQLYKVSKRILSLVWKNELYDFKGLIDDYTAEPRVLHFKNYGKHNREIPIYYITFGVYNEETCGFFGMFNTVLKYLCFADFYHLIPVVEWGKCIYSEEKEINGTQNVFEYYFQPVSDIDYRTVRKSSFVCPAIFSDTKIIYLLGEETDVFTEQNIELLSKVYKKYIKLNTKTEKKISVDIEEVLGQKRTLGVQARGTDSYLNLYGHPVAVQANKYIETVSEIFNKGDFEQIFLATEDETILEDFVTKFGDKLVYYKDTVRSTKSAIELAAENKNVELYNYTRGYEVLRDAYSLAVCDGLIGGIYNVPIAARIIKKSMGEEYDFCHIIDNGINSQNIFYTKSVYAK